MGNIPALIAWYQSTVLNVFETAFPFVFPADPRDTPFVSTWAAAKLTRYSDDTCESVLVDENYVFADQIAACSNDGSLICYQESALWLVCNTFNDPACEAPAHIDTTVEYKIDPTHCTQDATESFYYKIAEHTP